MRFAMRGNIAPPQAKRTIFMRHYTSIVTGREGRASGDPPTASPHDSERVGEATLEDARILRRFTNHSGHVPLTRLKIESGVNVTKHRKNGGFEPLEICCGEKVREKIPRVLFGSQHPHVSNPADRRIWSPSPSSHPNLELFIRQVGEAD
jgi:hypothetical protein